MADENAQDGLDERNWQIHWGQLLRTARQVAGLSLGELSVTTGLSKGYLSKLESGHVTALNPSRATLAALARALPSFRALAHTLEPNSHLGPLTFAVPAPRVPEVIISADTKGQESPVHLGWRELEVVVALMTLERAAVPQPTTALVLARALGRAGSEIESILEQLTEMGVLVTRPPVRFGAPPTFARSDQFEARVGISRVGDALILAAALLAQGPMPPRRDNTRRQWDGEPDSDW